MANKKKKRFQFQLGWPGLIFSLGLLVCLFLWMFVLGFYFGQRVAGKRVQKLSSPVSEQALSQQAKEPPPPVFEEVSPPPLAEKKLAQKEKPASQETSPAPKKASPPPKVAEKPQKAPKTSSKQVSKTPSKPKEPQHFYAIQIASLRSAAEAQKYVKYLRQKGYDAFYRKIVLPQKGTWYRVYVGRFKSISQARRFGEKLKEREKLSAFYIQKLSSEK
ncbi:MAG: SPOR domain-containing protein [Thermodesulfobacteria bacterium]|nr:SPOR domain-containing protein [Thermodesulfobacteriota bacterium]